MIEAIYPRPEWDGAEGLLALIISRHFDRPGTTFLTDRDQFQQLAFVSRPAGTCIQAHVHPPSRREVARTQEVLLIRRGRVRVDFFTSARVYVCSRVLGPGDVVALLGGGHGFEVLEDLEMWEVKNGPFAGDGDKVKFNGTLPAA